jgi:hypothetical protein
MKPIGTASVDIYVRLYLDHPIIGCGYREFLVLKRGRKWVRLLCISIFDAVTLPQSLFTSMTMTALPFKKGRLEARVRENARLYAARNGLLQEAVRVVKKAKVRT